MTAQLKKLIDPIRHSPLRVEVLETLQEEHAKEKKRREEFYRNMTPEEKVEFIDGEVIMHSPARNAHLIATQNLTRLMSFFVESNQLGEVRTEKCLCTFPTNDYEPDIVFFGAGKSASLKPDTMRFPVPDFIVEVLSKSTEDRDRGIKFQDYALHGVQEYWIIDAENQVVEQYLNTDGDFDINFKGGSGEISAKAISNFTIPVRAIFDQAESHRALKELL